MAIAERKPAWTPRAMQSVDDGPEIGYAQIGELHYDWLRWIDGAAFGYQRPLEEDRVAKAVREYDPGLIRSVICSRRPDGSLWVLDGQHTVEIERRMGREVVRVEIYTGLTPQQEASRYYHLNRDRKTPNLWNQFGTRASSGDPVALAVIALASECGFRVGTADRSIGSIAAVGVLERIYQAPDGARLLRQTLGLVREIWPAGLIARDGVFIEGLSRFLYTWDGSWYETIGNTIEYPRLRTVLSKTEAVEVQRAAKRLKIEAGLAMNANTYALALRDLYNGTAKFTRRLGGRPVTPSRLSGGKLVHRAAPNRQARS